MAFASTKIIPNSFSVHAQERFGQSNFCVGAKMRRDDLESGASYIG